VRKRERREKEIKREKERKREGERDREEKRKEERERTKEWLGLGLETKLTGSSTGGVVCVLGRCF
jgi:hypothetical protein